VLVRMVKSPVSFQTKKFLGIVTVFAALMLTFPYYSHVFYPNPPQKELAHAQASSTATRTIDVKGMTCNSCAAHIENEVARLEGVVSVDASYEEAHAKVRFDPSELRIARIEKAIKETGYQVTGRQ